MFSYLTINLVVMQIDEQNGFAGNAIAINISKPEFSKLKLLSCHVFYRLLHFIRNHINILRNIVVYFLIHFMHTHVLLKQNLNVVLQGLLRPFSVRIKTLDGLFVW